MMPPGGSQRNQQDAHRREEERGGGAGAEDEGAVKPQLAVEAAEALCLRISLANVYQQLERIRRNARAQQNRGDGPVLSTEAPKSAIGRFLWEKDRDSIVQVALSPKPQPITNSVTWVQT